MPMHAWLPSIPPPCVDGPSLALLSRTRRGLLAAVSTALVLSACAAPGASVGPVLDVPLSPANAATHVLLADFESQAALTGERVVIPTPAQPKVPGSHVQAWVSSKDKPGDALTIQWKDAWYASLRLELAQPADLRPFLSEGALELDLDATDMAHAGLTFATSCGPDCSRKLSWVVASRAIAGKGWQHLVVPMRCFAHAGDAFDAVSQVFQLDSSGTGEAAIANVRFVAHAAGGLACPDYRTESVTPRPLEQVWSMDGWIPRHEAKLASISEAAAAKRPIDLVFIGDSITEHWERDGKAVWARHYAKYNALDLGFGGDHTENVLWRLQHGEIDGFRPKVAVVMIGTNNTGDRQEDPRTTAAGIRRILDEIRARQPETRILLLAVFPRDQQPTSALRRLNDRVNAIISGDADGRHIFFLDIGAALTNADGTLSRDVMPDLLHPDDKGYDIWATQMEPTLLQLLARP
jgi:lysophospholipase L1-like esterase